MINTDDFIKRLEIILEYYSLSASGFADKIGVQRSSLSHLLSGRNRPSLDFIIKVVEVFPEVDLYWILNGKGGFPKSDLSLNKMEEIKNNSGEEANVMEKSIEKPNLFSDTTIQNLEKEHLPNEFLDSSVKTNPSNSIERIVIFFKDGTFKNYIP